MLILQLEIVLNKSGLPLNEQIGFASEWNITQEV